MSFIDFLHIFDVAMFAVTIVCLCGTAYELHKGRRLRRAHEERRRAHEQRMAEIRNGRNQ